MGMELKIRLAPRPALVRWWRRIVHPRWNYPIAESGPWWQGWYAIVVPYSMRGAHEAYARAHGYFWIPCPLCDKPFGGHEGLRYYGKPDKVPDPIMGECFHIMICPACTKAGRGHELSDRALAEALEIEVTD